MHGRTACAVFEVESLSSVPRDVYRYRNDSSGVWSVRLHQRLLQRSIDNLSFGFCID
ncbi:hypothetical protein Poly59_30050 [Rubripirellula reticaptiva]|uniref:Uncharacterized protein n=1 Tax=Rubripirellula reticaptiva TaxID=2528013 RepID=A0A5C6ENT4_9BACT|nr:hypothetical protein Poly59_30050 [Rubripirellula reticaptiva]